MQRGGGRGGREERSSLFVCLRYCQTMILILPDRICLLCPPSGNVTLLTHGSQPSTGFMGVFLALQLCRHVSLYGMGAPFVIPRRQTVYGRRGAQLTWNVNMHLPEMPYHYFDPPHAKRWVEEGRATIGRRKGRTGQGTMWALNAEVLPRIEEGLPTYLV